jgi:hypothetical protein
MKKMMVKFGFFEAQLGFKSYIRYFCKGEWKKLSTRLVKNV